MKDDQFRITERGLTGRFLEGNSSSKFFEGMAGACNDELGSSWLCFGLGNRERRRNGGCAAWPEGESAQRKNSGV